MNHEPNNNNEPQSQLPSEATGCSGGAARHCPPRGNLVCHNWLGDIPGDVNDDADMVEVLFKNTRKGYYKNSTHLPLEIGDLVAVEASPGHDIGRVSLLGPLVARQIKKANIKQTTPVKRVFRKAKPVDIEKFEEAKAKENDTMIRARKIAEELHLNMKIGDVEYQGDGNKAIFYYIADERVDFRQLIKVLADAFKVRIEMKQIGARQEAGRIGGIGPCGRALCCASWLTNFQSVGTAAARFQDISLNPQKLAGQCAKLKCCLNYEVDAYVEGVRRMPAKDVRLETADSTWYHFKHDVFKRTITYSTDKSVPANLTTIDANRAFEVIAMNKAGEKPLTLSSDGENAEQPRSQYADILGQDSINRFDKKKKKRKGKGNRSEGKKAEATKAESPKADNPTPDNAKGEGQRHEGGSSERRRDNRRRRSGNRNKGQAPAADNQPSNPAD